ncbi:346_t:CDS:2 [Cetraspora pellucida]|uniref:346_t:CDS:1 n=1 Tax=Cetraspora pellucida TaxID=1433469 RepID=A0ACA9KAB2_9GLOM|nr:346_t:CDS:2 [Cetraspora pellucida]
MNFLSFPEYNGSCHPEDWLRNFKFVATFQEKMVTETELVRLALLKISRSIYRDNNNSITNFSQLLEFLKADPSFSIFKVNSERKLLSLRFTYLTDVKDFITELRQLLSDAEIFELKLQKQSIIKILPSKFFPDTFSLKIAESQNIHEVFINLQNFLFQYKRIIKYGSVITLRHVDTGKLLSSSREKHRHKSQEDRVFTVDRRPTDYESWTIMPEISENRIPPVFGGNKKIGSLVYYGDRITLRNNGTGMKLYSSNYCGRVEVSCYNCNNSYYNWVAQHYVIKANNDDVEVKVPWNECHDIVLISYNFNRLLGNCGYMFNDGNQEVGCVATDGSNYCSQKWHANILDEFDSNKELTNSRANGREV